MATSNQGAVRTEPYERAQDALTYGPQHRVLKEEPGTLGRNIIDMDLTKEAQSLIKQGVTREQIKNNLERNVTEGLINQNFAIELLQAFDQEIGEQEEPLEPPDTNIYETRHIPNIYEHVFTGVGPNVRKLTALDRTTLKIARGESTEAVEQELEDNTLEEFQQEDIERVEKEEQESISEVIGKLAIERSDLLPKVVRRSLELNKEKASQAENVLAPYIAYIKSFPNSVNLSEEEIKEQAVAEYTLYEMGKGFDEDSIFGNVIDIFGAMLLEDTNFNNASYLDFVLRNGQYLRNFTMSPDGFKLIANMRDQLSAEDQFYFDKHLRAVLPMVDDNNFQQLIIGLNALGANPSMDAENIKCF
jgi:hypothetical protein